MSQQLDLLELAARSGPPHERAIVAIAALTDHSAAEAMTWSLPACDARLLELYRERYGAKLRAVSACPQCGGVLELSFAVDDLVATLTEPDAGQLALELDGYELELRLPTVSDLSRAGQAGNVARAQELIAAGCVRACSREGEPVGAGGLPAPVLDQIQRHLEQFDLGGEGLELTCPDCSTRWSATLDVPMLVLAELDFEGQRLLADVHILARSYGWSEAEIVELPAERRRKYVEMVLG